MEYSIEVGNIASGARVRFPHPPSHGDLYQVTVPALSRGVLADSDCDEGTGTGVSEAPVALPSA